MRPIVLTFTVALVISAAAPALAGEPPLAAREAKARGDRKLAGGDAAGAEAAYRAALSTYAPWPEAWEALGRVQSASDRFAEAADSYARALEVDPGRALAWYNLAFAARKAGDLSRARDGYRRYLALRPEDPDGHLGLGETLRAAGDRDGAVREYDTFIGLAEPVPSQAKAVAKARELVAELRAPGARASLSAATSSAPAVTARAAPLLAARTAAPAATQRQPVPAAPAPLALRKIALGDELMKKGDLRGALFAYQDATALDTTCAEARFKLGNAYERLDHLPEAVQQWEYAVLLEPPHAAAQDKIARARAVLASGGTSTREPEPEPASEAPSPPAPVDTPARVSYEAGVALVAKGLYAEALASLDEAVRRDPRLGAAFAARGSARFGLGRYPEAADDYQKALELDGGLGTPLYGLAECYRMMERPEPAARYYAAYAATPAPDASEELKAEARRRVAELRQR
jgi:tetratricopeptide (TPR) repeat protein